MLLKVKEWVWDLECGEETIGAFFQYCFAFAESAAEERELLECMLKLVTLYVEEDTWLGNWNGAGWNQGVGKWDWSQLSLANEWEILLPEWAYQRELEDVARSPGNKVVSKEIVVKEELLTEEKVLTKEVKDLLVKEDVVEKEDVVVKDLVVKEGMVEKDEEKTSKVELGVSESTRDMVVVKKDMVVKEDLVEKEDVVVKDLVVKEDMVEKDEEKTSKVEVGVSESTRDIPVAFTPWRPWDEEVVSVVGSENVGAPKKRKSPAAAARSARRLLQFQEKLEPERGPSRLQLLQRSTPQKPAQGRNRTNLLSKFKQTERCLPVWKVGISGGGDLARSLTVAG